MKNLKYVYFSESRYNVEVNEIVEVNLEWVDMSEEFNWKNEISCMFEDLENLEEYYCEMWSEDKKVCNVVVGEEEGVLILINYKGEINKESVWELINKCV